jgi:hypothetical protein
VSAPRSTDLQDLVKELFGGSVEVIEVPAGKTIEDVVREREAPATNPAPTPGDIARDGARQHALTALRKHMAEILERYDMLKQLEKSIATPDAQRTPKHALNEILLSLKLGM